MSGVKRSSCGPSTTASSVFPRRSGIARGGLPPYRLERRRGALEQQRRLLETRQNATAPIEYQRQLAAIDQQAQLLEQQQNARFIAAQTRSQQQVDHALNDALARVVTRAACSLVLDRDHSYGWNNAMDVTAAVTKEMDTILPSVVLQ